MAERVEIGQVWERRKDGVRFKVLWDRSFRDGVGWTGDRIQLIRADATNRKNTHWLWVENLRRLYRLVESA